MTELDRRRTALVANPGADRYGSDRMLLESVSGLVEAGWRTVVTVPGPGPLVDLLGERGAEVVVCATPVLRRTDLTPRGLVRLVGAVARGLYAGHRLLRRVRPDAVYVNTVTIPVWLLLARLHRIPAVCHVHEAEDAAPAAQRLALALPLFLAKRVIANSEFSRRVLLTDARRLAGRTSVILNGVEGPPRVGPARAELSEPVRLVYVGRLSVRKGVDLAIEAVRHLRDRDVGVQLDIVGAVFPGYEWFEEQLRAQILSADLADQVRLLGFSPQVWAHLEAADVALVPSRIEPFGNTAVEALLCARPVVVAGVPGLVEATSGFSSAHVFTPEDAGALADAVEAIIASWPQQRDGAARDAVAAGVRYAPARYRSAVAAAVDAVTRASALRR